MAGHGPAVGVGLTFVPEPSATIVARDVGGRLLLLDEQDRTVVLLTELGSALWRQLDGKKTLEQIIDALAEEFPDDDELEYEAWDLTEELLQDGLLGNVPAAPAATSDEQGVVPVGTEFGPFRLAELDGAELDLADLRGRQALLVNWNPGCSFCRQIAPELARLESALGEQDVELVLLASGGEDANRALRDEHGFSSRILLRADGVDPFAGAGTPVAYLLDAEGRVAQPRVVGADAVPALARWAAGVSNGEARPVARQVPVAFVRTGEPASADDGEGWREAVAYDLGELTVGIRADTAAAEELVARFLAGYETATEGRIPANYSISLGENPQGSSRALRRLFQADTVVARSRSTRRILLALAAYLSEHLPGAGEDVVRTDNLAVVVGGDAFLLPVDVADRVDDLEPRLNALGASLVDEQYASIAPATGELVVAEHRLKVDTSVLAELDDPADAPRVEPGRYPLRGWLMWDWEFDNEQPTEASSVYVAFDRVVLPPDQTVGAAVDDLEQLLARVPVVTVPEGGPQRLVGRLERHLAAS
jgi:thiol-disulfide isomerase/thioredoxin